jgi:VanZ family protein
MTFMPAVLLTAGIAILSLTESTHMPAVSVSDKLMHGVMYLLLAVSWMIPVRRPVWVCVAVTLYGGLLELLQYACTLTRSGEWIDLLADFLGALIGVLSMILFQRLHEKMRK